MRPAEDIEGTLETYGPAVWRICMLHLRNQADAQDAYQETFLKYALADEKRFEGEEHRKAWLLRVASNTCKDMLKSAARRNVAFDEAKASDPPATDPLEQPESGYREAIDALRALDDPPRTPLYLSLVEGYPATEIARMLDAPINTVYSWISRGKKQLKEALS